MIALHPAIAAELLHVFSPPEWHGDAVVVGTAGGLLRLRAAVDRALETGAGVQPAMVEDGEGYWLVALKVSPEQWAAMGEDGLGLPYTQEHACGGMSPAVDALASEAVVQTIKERGHEQP